MINLKEIVKKTFFDQGFHLVGFTNSLEPIHKETFIKWISLGYHGKMDYMRKTLHIRLNPTEKFPWAKTAIVVALNYRIEPRPRVDNLFFARYSTIPDYHKLMEKMAKKAIQKLKEKNIFFNFKIYVDTGPLPERDLAMRAGLGFIGKNTNLIAFKKGSYFLLGIILTSLELEPDNPIFENFCGKCTLCMKACPTQAIVEPFLLDATKCISYLTIELKEKIPEEFHNKLSGWVFGCDICQEVCPWNRKIHITYQGERVNLPPREDIVSNPEVLKYTAFRRVKIPKLLENFQIAEKSLKYLPSNSDVKTY